MIWCIIGVTRCDGCHHRRTDTEATEVTGFENHLWLVSSSDFNSNPTIFSSSLDDLISKESLRQKTHKKVRLGYIGVPPITPSIYDFIENKNCKIVLNEVQRQFSIPAYNEDYVERYIKYTYPYSIMGRIKDIQEQIKMQPEILATLGRLGAELEELSVDKNSMEYMMKALEIKNYTEQNKRYIVLAAKNLVSYHIDNDPVYVHMGNSALRAVGGLDTVNAISIYAEDFDAKENILAHLDKWNDTHEREKQVRYTDMVGMMMTMVESMLNAITYVLVAFTAISLVVSSVMIGIITYVSVVERTKEIGVLRSLGARKKDIKNLFNAETFIIGLTSGVFGVGVTYLLSLGINALLGSLTGIATLAALKISSALIMIVVSFTLMRLSGSVPITVCTIRSRISL